MVPGTVMVRLSSDAGQAVPCRLAGLFWQENVHQSRRPLQLARGTGYFGGRYQPIVESDEAGRGEGGDSSVAHET